MTGRVGRVERATKETKITVEIDLDGTGTADVDTGVPFFDHMLDAFGKHGAFDLSVHADGDTHIDVHHTVEDTSIVLGQAIRQALGGTRRASAASATPGSRWTRHWRSASSMCPAVPTPCTQASRR